MMKIETLSARLKSTLKILGISQTELAKKIKVKPQIIQYLCSSNTIKSKFTFEIADALGIDAVWLATGKGIIPCATQLNSQEKKMPIFSFEQIKNKFIYQKEIDITEIKFWLPIRDSINQDVFAIEINDVSMAPRFDLKTIIVIDPKANIEQTHFNNRFVLVYLIDEDFVIFRQLDISDNFKNLIPLNNILYKKVQLKKNDTILGLCKEAIWNF